MTTVEPRGALWPGRGDCATTVSSCGPSVAGTTRTAKPAALSAVVALSRPWPITSGTASEGLGARVVGVEDGGAVVVVVVGGGWKSVEGCSASALLMNRCQMAAGYEPPVTRIGVAGGCMRTCLPPGPTSGKPTHTDVASAGVNPPTQASPQPSGGGVGGRGGGCARRCGGRRGEVGRGLCGPRPGQEPGPGGRGGRGGGGADRGGGRLHAHLPAVGPHLGEAHPHGCGQCRGEPDEPGVAPVVGGAGLAGRWAADGSGATGSALDDLAEDGGEGVGHVGLAHLPLALLVLEETGAVSAGEIGRGCG